MSETDAREWLKSAEDDIRWARLSFDGGLFTRACFACQQAVEKSLKAFLIARTRSYPRIHVLRDLLTLAAEVDDDLQQFRAECEILDRFYLPTRYPALDIPGDFDASSAKKAIEMAASVVEAIRARIIGNFA